MNLELLGKPVAGQHGFSLQANDDQQPVSFILPESVAISAFSFDTHSGELLERIVNDRLPEVWRACRCAYALALENDGKAAPPVILSPAHFSTV